MGLDARPGGIIYRDIIPDYVKFVRTIYEGLSFPSIFSTIHCGQSAVYPASLLEF